MCGLRWLENLLQEVQSGIRVLIDPGFATVSVLTLMLG